MEGFSTKSLVISLAVAIVLTILIVWFMSKKETLIDPTINFKIARGYNLSNGNGYFVPIQNLSAVEHSRIGSFDNPAKVFV